MAAFTLSSGQRIPAVAYGTGTAWYNKEDGGPLNRELIDSIKEALKLGYRHLDGAEMYGTEREVGVALREFTVESGVPRSDIFVTTKVFRSLPNVKQALKDSLDRLQLQYVDLYLIHAPFFSHLQQHGKDVDLKQVWKDMESLLQDGLVKSIGVSNFRVKDLKQLLSFGGTKPVVNQIEHHPYLQQPDIVDFCKANGILIESYSPLASVVHKPGGPVDSVVEGLAAKHNKTPAEILLRWNYQKGHVVITTSGKSERLRAFLAVPDFELSPDDGQSIDAAGRKDSFRKYWDTENFTED